MASSSKRMEDNLLARADLQNDGFTLLEVMASVVIIGVAMTVVMTDRNESVRRVAITENMRTATMLAQQKMSEIVLGTESGTSGDFEDYAGFSWEIEQSSEDMLQENGQTASLNGIVLVVAYPAGMGHAELKLNMHFAGGKQ
jgi:prepilin-type N-terminal cleavage/methylation domain-containing protein